MHSYRTLVCALSIVHLCLISHAHRDATKSKKSPDSPYTGRTHSLLKLDHDKPTIEPIGPVLLSHAPYPGSTEPLPTTCKTVHETFPFSYHLFPYYLLSGFLSPSVPLPSVLLPSFPLASVPLASVLLPSVPLPSVHRISFPLVPLSLCPSFPLSHTSPVLTSHFFPLKHKPPPQCRVAV